MGTLFLVVLVLVVGYFLKDSLMVAFKVEKVKRDVDHAVDKVKIKEMEERLKDILKGGKG